MRKIILWGFVLLVLAACKKTDGDGGGGGNGNGNNNPPDSTMVPPAATVNTELVGYLTDGQNQLLFNHTNRFYLINDAFVPPLYTVMGNGMFTTGNIVTDQYHTRTEGTTTASGYLESVQAHPLTNSIRNYIRVKIFQGGHLGTVRNDIGGTFSFGSGGSITYGTGTFYQLPLGSSPGLYLNDMSANIFLRHADPEDKDFCLKLPSYLAGDENQQRFFLKSFGAVYFRMSNGYPVDFWNNNTADLKMPIAPGMLSAAPDSIQAWNLYKGIWYRAGWAHKQGSFYVKKIGKAIPWNFAIPVKGVYINIQLRTDSNATITNTAIRIRSNNRVIAETRTDADGNAVCFVPTYESLTAEVVPDERSFSPNTYSYPIGQVTKASTISVKMPSSTPELTSIIANVLDCNGAPVTNGLAKILPNSVGQEYYIPVKDGKMATAVWMYGGQDIKRIQVTDNTSGTTGEITDVWQFYGDIRRVNLYACQNPTLLYCNYTIDNTVYSLTDNATSQNVFMTATKVNPVPDVTIRTTNSAGKGVDFTVAFIPGVSVTTGLITNLKINGVSYNYDPSINPVIATSRFDASNNGFIDSYAIIYYKDNANVQHKLTASFRVKKNYQ